eukprot:sb/3479005/
MIGATTVLGTVGGPIIGAVAIAGGSAGCLLYPFWSMSNASRLTRACKVIVALDVVYEMFMISCYFYNSGGSVFLSLSQFAWGISDDMRQTELVGNL